MSALTTNPFDHGSRRLLRRAGVALLCWLLKVTLSQLRFVRWLDTRLTLPGQPERVCDTIAHVQRVDQGGFPWAIPVEFQVAPDPLMFGRAMVYEGMIWLQEKPSEEAGDRFDLQSVIVNLTGVGNSARRMAWLPGAGTIREPIEWNLETLDADVILDQVAKGEAPTALLAFVSLMKNGGNPATIGRWLEVANQESDPHRKADLALVVVFAQLTGHERTWQKALEGFNVIESVIVNEWKAQTAVKALMGILEDKFPPVPDEVKAKIEATTALDVLQRWVVLAAKVDSLDSFRRDAGI
jgi:hypothetical protein